MNSKTLTLEDILKDDPQKRKVENITEIYRGRDNYCRCGCGGVYHNKGSKGFTQALNRLSKGIDAYMFCNRKVEYGKTYINIPYDAENDKCYCIYFG